MMTQKRDNQPEGFVEQMRKTMSAEMLVEMIEGTGERIPAEVVLAKIEKMVSDAEGPIYED